ncbi:transmembrane protease serine 12-like [Chironomus tepperi]|uniref:transmembrane protease serine 12-like n=1 Tax=Chironomus tepperi TaxID=113505 RepID=UPI00391F6C3D
MVDTWSTICGGSIITDRTILSAGHCVHAIIDPDVTRWIVGVHSIQTAYDNQQLSYNYLTVHLHPLYMRTMLFDIYDMSIFVLNRQIIFSPKIVPICLPNAGDDKLYWNRMAIVAGWGRTSNKGPMTDLLMGTKVVLKTDKDCSVVSWGEGCANNFPGIYAKVSDQGTLSWIKRVIESVNANKCRDYKRF